GVLVAFVPAEVGFYGIVQELACRVMNRKWRRDRQGCERAEGPWNNQVLKRGLNAFLGPLAAYEAKADGEQVIASQGRVHHRPGGGFAGSADQQVAKITTGTEPDILVTSTFRAVGPGGPRSTPGDRT